MPASNQTAGQFISAVHRRMVVLYTAEQIGRGMMVASVLAIVLVCVAIWQSMPTFPVLIFCGGIGMVLGLALAVYRWPSRFSAAVEADRQLRLHDLLSTFLLQSTEDEFSQAVIAMADIRCRSHSPSEVVLRQLGFRSWSGIGLTMAVAATLAAIPLGAARSQATDANLSVLSQETIQPACVNSIQQPHGPMTRVNDPMSENASSNSMSAEEPAEKTGVAASPSNAPRGNTAGTNGGSSSTAPDASHQKLQMAGSSSQQQHPNGTTAGGGGAAAITSKGNGQPAGGTQSANRHTSTPDLVLNGNSHPDSAGPSQHFSDESVPSEDRDLVRDFFDRR